MTDNVIELVGHINEALARKDVEAFRLYDGRHRYLSVRKQIEDVLNRTGHKTEAFDRAVALIEDNTPTKLKKRVGACQTRLAKLRDKLLAINSQAEEIVEAIEKDEFEERVFVEALKRSEWYVQNDPDIFKGEEDVANDGKAGLANPEMAVQPT